MLKTISVGLFYLAITMVVAGLAGALGFGSFPPIAGILLYLLLTALADLCMAYAMSMEEDNDEGE